MAAKVTLVAHGMTVNLLNVEKFNIPGVGQFFDGTCHLHDHPEVQCSVLRIYPENKDRIMRSLYLNYVSKSSSFVKIYGFGGSSSRYAITERLQASDRILQYFYKHDLKMHAGNLQASSYDEGQNFIKEPTSTILRQSIRQYSEAIDNRVYPDSHPEGQPTFVINGQVKWLLVRDIQEETLPKDKKALSEALARQEALTEALYLTMFRRLIDERATVEEIHFFDKFNRRKSFYHSYLLTEIEREVFPYRLEWAIREMRTKLGKATFHWQTELKNYPYWRAGLNPLLYVIFRHRIYGDNLFGAGEYLRNFRRHAPDRKTLLEYQTEVRDTTAALPSLTDRLLAINDLFGWDYLARLWSRLDSAYFKIFNWGKLI